MTGMKGVCGIVDLTSGGVSVVLVDTVTVRLLSACSGRTESWIPVTRRSMVILIHKHINDIWI